MLVNVITSILMVSIIFYIWNDLSSTKIKIKNLKTILILFITSLILVLNYFFSNTIIKTINVILLFILSYKVLFKKKIRESIAAPLITQFLYLISESLFVIIMLLVLRNNADKFVNTFFGSVTVNLCTSISTLLLSKLSFIKKLYMFLNNVFTKISTTVSIFIALLLMLMYNIFTLNALQLLEPFILMIVSTIISILSFVFICIFFKTKDDYYKIVEKYNSSLLSLKSFEEVLNNYRVDNHENKNHLLTIRNMKSTKQITKFIDSILDNMLKDNKSIMSETSIIPSGGLRGLIYSKLLIMDKNKIDYELEVAPSMRLVDFELFDSDTALDICKIVGIFIDNAIEEVINLEEKYIIIEMYNEKDNIIISITNVFDNTKNKDNIYNVGFSTKGGNHGYGLSLVRKIINKNSNLETHLEINEDEFTQILEIKKP